KYLFYILLIFFVLHGIFTIFTAKGDYGLNTKKKLITEVMITIDNKPFDLSEEGACHKYEGWRYLFSIYGKKPEKSSEDNNFAWLYPNEVSNKPIKYTVIMKETRAPINTSGYQSALQN